MTDVAYYVTVPSINKQMAQEMTHQISTAYDPKPIPVRDFDWTATWDDYDGAEDSETRGDVGYGASEDKAVADLIDITGRRDDEPMSDFEERFAGLAELVMFGPRVA